MFETRVSKALNDSKIDEREFNMIQKLYHESLNDLSNVDGKMESEIRFQLQKMGRNKRPEKKRCLMMCTLFPVCYLTCYHRTKYG